MSVLDDFLPNVKSLGEIKPIAGIKPSLDLIKTAGNRLGSLGFRAIVVGLLSLIVIAQLFLQTMISQGAFTEQQMMLDVRTSSAQVQALEQQVSVMAAPATLAKRAENLGMVMMTTPVFLSIEDGQILGKPVAAQSWNTTTNNVQTMDHSTIALTKSGGGQLQTSQILTDDAAFLVSGD
ncbi:MAG: hypothetical protein RLZZ330_793 [Actinomycetota bacterium]